MKECLDLMHIHPSPVQNQPGFLFMPAGIFALMNEVRSHGFSVQIVNEPLELLIDNAFSLEDYIATHKARVYSIDCHWHEHIFGTIEVARMIKCQHPDSRIVVGGISASYFAADLANFCPDIDIVVAGFGEGILPQIIEGMNAATADTSPCILHSCC